MSFYCHHIPFLSSSLRHCIVVICTLCLIYVIVLLSYRLCVVLSTSFYCHMHFVSSYLSSYRFHMHFMSSYLSRCIVICTLCCLTYVILFLSYALCVVLSKSLYRCHMHFVSSCPRRSIVIICTLCRLIYVIVSLSYARRVVLSRTFIVVICTFCCPVCHCFFVICTLCCLIYVIVLLSYALCVVLSTSLYCCHMHFVSSWLRHCIVVICALCCLTYVIVLLSYALCVVL